MNWMKHTLAAAAIGIGTALTVAAPAQAEIKIALDSPMDLKNAGTSVWAHHFAEHLKANGMATEFFERGALGGEAEKLDQVSQGLLEVSMSDVKAAGKLDSTIMAIFLPFFFENEAHLDRALRDRGMLDRINAGTTPKGVRVLDVAFVGTSAGIFNTKKAVTKMSDMSDLRMRALDDVQIAIYKAWGTTGTIVAWGEVPNALQTGVADGYLNPPIVPLLFGHTSFIKHFTNAQIIPSSRVAIVSEDWYQGLSDKQRKIVDEAAMKAHAANREWVKSQGGVIEKLKKAGITVTELSDEERGKFRAATEPLYGVLPLPEGALDAWKKAAK